MSDVYGRFIGEFDRRIWASKGWVGSDQGRRQFDNGSKRAVLELDLPEKEPETTLSGVFPVPPGCEEIPRTTRLGVRCTPEAVAWVKGLADHCSLDVTSLVWQCLIRQAEASGFYCKVPQRYRRKSATRRRTEL